MANPLSQNQSESFLRFIFLCAGSCGDVIFGVASVTSSASRWQLFGYISHHIGGQLKIKDTDKGIILIMMRLMTMDNERRMIKLPLYYSMSRHDGTFPYGAHLLDSTWTSFMKRIDFDPWGFPLEDGTAMFLVDGEMVQMVDLRRQVSGLGLEVGRRCVDFMIFYELMWFESLEHIWKIWNKYI